MIRQLKRIRGVRELTLLGRTGRQFPSSASPRTPRPPEHSHPARTHTPQIRKTQRRSLASDRRAHGDRAELPDPPL
jgi:hypothetical protein